MSATNRQIRLAARPSGLPQRSDWELTSEPPPDPGAGEFVVELSHLSIDPAMRGWMNAGTSYIEPVEIGSVMRAGAVGRVHASDHPGFAVGDHVYGAFGVQEYAISDGTGVTKVDPSLAPLPTYLGALGMTVPQMASRPTQTGDGAVTYEERVVPADARGAHYLTQLVERLGWALLDAEELEAGIGAEGVEDARRRVIEARATGAGGRRARGKRASLLV